MSCGSSGGDDSDEIAPIVNFIDLSKTSPVKEYTAGQSVVFKATLSDNDVLKSITFDELSEETTIKTVPQFIVNFNDKLATAKPVATYVAGKANATVEFSVEIMPTAPIGIYTLTCTVIDDSNNQQKVKLYFKIV